MSDENDHGRFPYARVQLPKWSWLSVGVVDGDLAAFFHGHVGGQVICDFLAIVPLLVMWTLLELGVWAMCGFVQGTCHDTRNSGCERVALDCSSFRLLAGRWGKVSGFGRRPQREKGAETRHFLCWWTTRIMKSALIDQKFGSLIRTQVRYALPLIMDDRIRLATARVVVGQEGGGARMKSVIDGEHPEACTKIQDGDQTGNRQPRQPSHVRDH